MAGQRKRIVAICYGPIAFGPQYRSPWEDVWIRWKAKPGRRLYYAAPTLFTNALHPFIRASGRVTGLPRLAALESPRIHVVTPAEECAEERDLCLRGGGLPDAV